jgi:hypothetical protein
MPNTEEAPQRALTKTFMQLQCFQRPEFRSISAQRCGVYECAATPLFTPHPHSPTTKFTRSLQLPPRKPPFLHLDLSQICPSLSIKYTRCISPPFRPSHSSPSPPLPSTTAVSAQTPLAAKTCTTPPQPSQHATPTNSATRAASSGIPVQTASWYAYHP